jgi:diacylglycerol kinase family enzyme
MKAAGKKKINYTTLSIKLMFHGYKCPNATVVIDGVKKEFKHVWLGSTMNGRYYGGGMEVAPSQDRLSDSCSVVFFYGSGKIKTLMIFPKIFKGEHIKHTKNVQVMSGKDVTVTFSLPTALQIDGEVVKDVTSYRVIKD